MEGRASVHNRFGVFSHTAVQILCSGPVGKLNGVKIAGADTASAAYAVFLVDRHFMVCFIIDKAVIGTFPHAGSAAPAFLRVYLGLAVVVLILFPGAGTAAHADIFNGAAKAGCFMALKVGEADKDVCVHDGAANLGFLYVFAAANRNADIVCPFQPIGNDDGTAYGKRSKAVFPGAFQMLQRIFTAARIKSITIGKKRVAAKLLYHICYGLCVIRAEIGNISKLSKVHFNGNEFAVHIDVADTGLFHQAFQLSGKAFPQFGTKIRVINL